MFEMIYFSLLIIINFVFVYNNNFKVKQIQYIKIKIKMFNV